MTSDTIRRISNNLTTNSHSHTVHVDKVPRPNNPPYHMDQVQFLLIPKQQVSIPHHTWNYSNKPITDSHRNQGVSQPLDMTKPPTHSPWLFTPKCNLHGALCGVQCFLPLDCECIEQSANVICPVLGVVCLAIPMTQSWGSLPHQWGK